MTDWIYLKTVDAWIHPETKIVINGKDMPWELKPESNHD